MKYSDLITKVLGLAFPRRFSPSLLALKQHTFRAGLTDIQRYIPRFQESNVDIVAGSWDAQVSGATVLDAPGGEIVQVAVGGEGCETIHGTLTSHLHMQSMQASFARSYDCGDPELPPAYPTSKVFWARDDGDLMVYPWVPDGWSIGIRWRGIRRTWTDDTEIWWADEDRVTECLRRYMVAYDAEGCDNFGDLLVMYRDERSTLKFEMFRQGNPVQYNPYAEDILSSVKVKSQNDTQGNSAGAA